MLVLSRQRDESVIATLPNGELFVVTVVGIRGDKVRLGFTAAPNIPIHRQEVHEAIQRQNRKFKEEGHAVNPSIDLDKIVDGSGKRPKQSSNPVAPLNHGLTHIINSRKETNG